MANTIWKEFEANSLTHSAAHYLMAIRNHRQEHGYARVTDVARELKVTRGSCSISLKQLRRRGLVVEDDNKFLDLSPEGERLAGLVERNDELVETFFREVLGVDPEQAKIDACKIEHLLSLETSLKLAGMLHLVEKRNKVARDFIRILRKQASACDADVERCSLCDTTCLGRPKKRNGAKG